MSAFMLTAYAGTVVLMPFMVPWLATGFTADPWTIAKPLVVFIAIPLVIDAAIRRAAEPFAEKAAPVVKAVRRRARSRCASWRPSWAPSWPGSPQRPS